MNTNTLITADIHAGTQFESDPHKLKDLQNVLQEMVDIADDKDCGNIIVAGDLFHHKGRIQTVVYNAVFEIIENSDKHWTLLVGNHDLAGDNTKEFSHKAFRALPNVTCWSGRGEEKINGVPYLYHDYRDDVSVIVDWLREKIGESDWDTDPVFVGHFGFSDAVMGPAEYRDENAELASDTDIFDVFGAQFIGHYHRPQNLDKNTYIPGSPLQHNFGERDQQKRVLVLDHDSYDVEEVSLPGPQHIVVENEDDLEELQELEQPGYVRLDFALEDGRLEELRAQEGIRNVTTNWSRSENQQESRIDVEINEVDDKEIVEEYLEWKYDNDKEIQNLEAQHNITPDILKDVGDAIVEEENK